MLLLLLLLLVLLVLVLLVSVVVCWGPQSLCTSIGLRVQVPHTECRAESPSQSLYSQAAAPAPLL